MACLVLHSDIVQREKERREMGRGTERLDRQGRKFCIPITGAGLVIFRWWMHSWLLSCGHFCSLQEGNASHMLACEMEVGWIWHLHMHEGGRIASALFSSRDGDCRDTVPYHIGHRASLMTEGFVHACTVGWPFLCPFLCPL